MLEINSAPSVHEVKRVAGYYESSLIIVGCSESRVVVINILRFRVELIILSDIRNIFYVRHSGIKFRIEPGISRTLYPCWCRDFGEVVYYQDFAFRCAARYTYAEHL